ncbi:PQQ-binding-like beta-propeller repeat protein [Streptomyces sp. NPDC006512]|uniref:outer membrane protein assembly factor BamB family protein n=1 Tax=Streptomyces sp. NPDC006512 TaxID=3154307 RepID=UPI0033BA23CC
MRHTWRVCSMVMSAGLTLCLATACGGADQPVTDQPKKEAAPGPTTPPVPTASKSYDPPLKFGAKTSDPIAGGFSKGKWAVRLDGTTAYASSAGEVKAVGALDSKERWSIKPQGQPEQDSSYGTGPVARPTLVQIDGKAAVLAAFAVVVPGSGTTPSRAAIEITAVTAESGTRLWTATVDKPDRQSGGVVLIGSDGTTAVVRVGGSTTIGISLTTRQTVWTAKGFYGEIVDRGIVVGRGEGTKVTGLAITDGKEAWTNRESALELNSVGAGLFTANLSGISTRPQNSAALLDVSTGRPPAGMDEKALGEPTDLSCLHDQRSTIVCTADKGVFALDATTFKELWTIDRKDKSRLLPEVTTAWHGAVYAATTNGTVVLDALTGKDKATDPGLAPTEVNGYVGLSGTNPRNLNTTGEITAHPAVG